MITYHDQFLLNWTYETTDYKIKSLFSLQIENLQQSIHSLQEEISPKGGYFSAPLTLIFLSSAPVSLNEIDPLQLPDFPIALKIKLLY